MTPLERLALTYATALAAVIGATWAWVAVGDAVVRRTGLTGLFPRLPSTEVRDRFAVAVLVGTTAVAAVAPAVVARARAGRAPGVARPGLTGALALHG